MDIKDRHYYFCGVRNNKKKCGADNNESGFTYLPIKECYRIVLSTELTQRLIGGISETRNGYVFGQPL